MIIQNWWPVQYCIFKISPNIMDYKQLRKILAERTGRSAEDVDALVEGLSVVLQQCGSELHSVAVPTFGTFTTVKHDEEIRQDLSTGKRMLLPPEIVMEFTPGATLLRRLNPVDGVIR